MGKKKSAAAAPRNLQEVKKKKRRFLFIYDRQCVPDAANVKLKEDSSHRLTVFFAE